MEADIAMIWFEVQQEGEKPFILGEIYHEHKLLNRPGPNETGDFQDLRWRKILQQWASTQGAEEMLIAGDINLDHICRDNPERKHKRMVKETREKIETLGFVQLVHGPTRFWRETAPSLLDQVWSNHPNKIFKYLKTSSGS